MENIHEDIVVKDFDADVAVKPSSDEGGDQGDHVTSSLPCVGTNTLVAWLEAILALVVIHEASVHEVDSVYEELRPPHRFEKVARSSHLGQKLDEKLGARISQYTRQQAVD